QGNELGAQISAAGLIPVIGPGARRFGRGARSLVDRLLGRGEREVADVLGTEASRGAMAATGAGADTGMAYRPGPVGQLYTLPPEELERLSRVAPLERTV